MKKNRIIGLDILRILSMCGIVGLHIINKGGLINNANIHSIEYYVILSLLVLFYTSVDIFGILSGYLNVDKENIKTSRIIELISILVFWGGITTLVFYLFNISNVKAFGKIEMLKNTFTILAGCRWYIVCYILLFFMIPYINMFCKNIGKDNLKKFLITGFIFFCIIPNIFFMRDLFKLFNGYSPFWLIYCYMLGCYLRLYDINIDKLKCIKYVILLFCCTFIMNSIIRNIGMVIFNKIILGDWFINYISPFTLIMSLLMVLLFTNVNINNDMLKKMVIYLSNASFSVYIIHGHRLIFEYVWSGFFKFLLNYNFVIILFTVPIITFVVYSMCCIIDLFRKLVFKLCRIDTFINFVGSKIDGYLKI